LGCTKATHHRHANYHKPQLAKPIPHHSWRTNHLRAYPCKTPPPSRSPGMPHLQKPQPCWNMLSAHASPARVPASMQGSEQVRKEPARNSSLRGRDCTATKQLASNEANDLQQMTSNRSWHHGRNRAIGLRCYACCRAAMANSLLQCTVHTSLHRRYPHHRMEHDPCICALPPPMQHSKPNFWKLQMSAGFLRQPDHQPSP